MTERVNGQVTVLLVGVDERLLLGPQDLAVLVAAPDGPHGGGSRGVGVPDSVDAVVVGVATRQELGRLQTWHRRHPDAGAVVVVPDGDPEAVRRALVYTPGIPADVQVVERTDRTLVDVVRTTASRSARTRRHRTVLQSLVDRPQSPRPSLGPAVDALALVLDRAPLGVLTVDADGDLVGWNARAATLLGLRGQDTGTPLAGLLDSAHVAVELSSVATNRREAFSHGVTTRPLRQPDVVVEINAIGADLADGRPGALLLLMDVSVRRAAEAARDELYDRLRVVRRSQEFLLRASDVLAQADDYASTLEQLAAVAVPTLGDLCLIDVLEDGRFRRIAARHADPAQQHLVDILRAEYVPSPDSDHPASVALRDGRAQWTFEVDQDWLAGATRDERHLDVVRQLKFTGWIAVPLVAGSEVLGVVTLVSCGDSRRLEPDDVVLADELAGRVAQVVAKARRYDREHEIAVVLQRSMLTALPDLSPLTVAARYLPAREDTQVGGDWYDAFVQPGSPPVVVIGDVVGHDLTAATAMGQVRNAMRALAWGRSARPAEVLTALEEFNSGMRITDFTTVLYGVVEAHPAAQGGGSRGALFRWSSAGHLPPLVVRADGSAEYLWSRPDVVIGVRPSPERTRTEHVAELPSGSTLLLYTDGLVERRHEPLAVGLEEFRELVAGLAAAPLEQLCDEVLAARAGARDDDIAVLAVRIP